MQCAACANPLAAVAHATLTVLYGNARSIVHRENSRGLTKSKTSALTVPCRAGWRILILKTASAL